MTDVGQDKEELVMQLEVLRAYKRMADAATETYRNQQALVQSMMRNSQTKTSSFGGWRYTLVQGESTTYDEAKLRKAMGAAAYNKLTKRVLDKIKLNRAVAEGNIDLTTLAQSVTITSREPFVRITKDKEE